MEPAVFRESRRMLIAKKQRPRLSIVVTATTASFEEWLSELEKRIDAELRANFELRRGVKFEVLLRVTYHPIDGATDDFTKDVSGGRFGLSTAEQIPGCMLKILEHLCKRHDAYLKWRNGCDVGKIEHGSFRVLNYFTPTPENRLAAERDVLNYLIRTDSPSIQLKRCKMMMARVKRNGKTVPRIWWCHECKRCYRNFSQHLYIDHPDEYQDFKADREDERMEEQNAFMDFGLNDYSDD